MRGFGELASAIMDRMWAADRPLTVRDMLEDLQTERTIAYTTVMTVMDILHRKGWLKRELNGRAYHYQPVTSREEYSAALMREALDASTDPHTTLVQFLEQLSPTQSESVRHALRRVTSKRNR